MTKKRWELMVACNNYRNGVFAGRASEFRIQLGSHNLSLEGSSVKFRWVIETGRIVGFRTCGQLFLCSGHREWVGNWCWDMVKIDRATVRRLCKALASREFTPCSGTTRLFEWYGRLEVPQ